MDTPPGYLRAFIERRLDVADDLAVFWLRPDEPLGFAPGQYLTLATAGADGRLVKRAYSIASAPHEPLVELVIEHVPAGMLTPPLWELGVGDAVWVRRRVTGHFVLDANRRHHVMACTVTGVAPFLSMLRDHADAMKTGRDTPGHRFLVLHGASHSAEFGPYRAELESLAEQGWVDAIATVSRPWDDATWAGEVGRVGDVLRKHLDRQGWPADDIAGYACGHPQMVTTVAGMLRRAGVPADQIYDESYFTESVAEPRPPPTRPAPGPPGGIALRSVPRTGTGGPDRA